MEVELFNKDLSSYWYCPYWKDRHIFELKQAKTFERVTEIALSVMETMPQELSQLCGPITTGGFGDELKNRKIFNRCVIELRVQKLNPFDQTLLEKAIGPLKIKWKKINGAEKYCKPILNVLYKGIFQSGKIKRTFFLPNWHTSEGSVWERNLIQSLGIEINEFPESWYQKILEEFYFEVVR